MTITQIRKKFGDNAPIQLSNGDTAFKIDDKHVHIIKLEELIHPKDYSYIDKGVFELPIVLISEDKKYIGSDYNSNEIFAEERKYWISVKDLPKTINAYSETKINENYYRL